MGPPHRGGTFSPSPAQRLVTASNHSPHGSFSAGPSPSTNSPTSSTTGTHGITVAQIYVLLSTLKEGKNWDQTAEQLRKLVDEQESMEVFYKYFNRLLSGNAPHIFGKAQVPAGSYQVLVEEMQKIAVDPEQAGKIAGAIETGNEEVFQDFDLSSFMDHFNLDALEKTILALAFKVGTRQNLKTKADAILSTNCGMFLQLLAQQAPINPTFVALILDRYIQRPPPTFDQEAQSLMLYAIARRYTPGPDQVTFPPLEVSAACHLMYLLTDTNAIVTNMHQVGSTYTADEEMCIKQLRKVPSLTEEQVGLALLYAAISLTPEYQIDVLVAAVRKVVPANFSWEKVIAAFDRQTLRITSNQFLRLFDALLPIAQADNNFDIQRLWGGRWNDAETQLTFIRAFTLQKPQDLDLSTIPRFQQTISLEAYTGTGLDIIDRAADLVRHPLVSFTAMKAIFETALNASESSLSVEAKRLFQDVIFPNIDLFIVSAFGIPQHPIPWPSLATVTFESIFHRYLWQDDPHWKFVFHSVWHLDKGWMIKSLIDVHGKEPLGLPVILDRALTLGWLDELVLIINGFGLDLAALAHSQGMIDLDRWARNHGQTPSELRRQLLVFLKIKVDHELRYQREKIKQSVMLPVRTVSALLNILDELSPKPPGLDLVLVQRNCITAYPRLINYGQGYDDIIDANGAVTNEISPSATQKMEEHYKKMYSDALEVRQIIDKLNKYKRSRDPSEQEVFACMIHGLFDEYQLYGTYPDEALATTAVLFGAIIYSKLISDLPLEIGLGMILEAIEQDPEESSMYKFGLQALMQILGRFHEWPGFCSALLKVNNLRNTEPWNKAEEVVRKHDEEMTRNANGIEPTLPPFASINVEPSKHADKYEEPSGDTQEKVVFVLNNTTQSNLEVKFKELKEVVEEKYQGWFAAHLVEERAKMQPNYLQLYLDVLRHFDSKTLYYEVLRETYGSVMRMLNAETTMQSAIERNHLKNLAGWLGSLTLARDKPILHKNIAFKQLLIEAFDTQRLIIVVPFVCKVLVEGASSVVFKPPNPWLMDIVHLLIELYHSAELKLNLKFEIEVLCKGLGLDHKSIEPSKDIQTRVLPIDEPLEAFMDGMDNKFENLALTGAVGSGRFSPNDIVSTVPDLGPLLTYPPPNDMVNQQGLHDIVRTAITRAVHEIISPVVERSVTIAAISTAQMIRKDFATEPDEAKVRAAAVAMVKMTAGSLALVTSKEPLRASMNNYIRHLQNQTNQGLPEGTIIMCVNSNLDMACAQVEKKAEEKAVPEIEEMLEPDLEARRQHRLTRPGDAYIDTQLSRWGMTIPNPFKLEPNMRGLNPEQMSIYEEFGRQPRVAVPSTTGPSISDPSKAMTMDAFDGQFPPVSGMPTPGEAMPHLVNQPHLYPQRAAGLANGRTNGGQGEDARYLIARIQKLFNDLLVLTGEAPEQHYEELQHSHPIIEIIDRLCQLIIVSSQADSASGYTSEQICNTLFSNAKYDDLTTESLAHLLGQLCKMHPDTTGIMVKNFIVQQPEEALLNVPLALALLRADFGLLDWQRIDEAASNAIRDLREGVFEFLSSLMDRVLLNERPLALRTDLVRSFDALGEIVAENPDLEAAHELMQKLQESGLPQRLSQAVDAKFSARQDQMEYVFEEWIHLCNNPMASQGAIIAMVAQINQRRMIHGPDDSIIFFRLCIEVSVDRFEQIMSSGGKINDAYNFIDALGKLVARLVIYQGHADDGTVESSKATYLKQTLTVIALVLNHHHLTRGENFNQKVFFRLFSTTMVELNKSSVRPSKAADDSSSNRAEPREESREEPAFVSVFAYVFLVLQPLYFPGFVFGWLALVSHRAFLPKLLALEEQRGWEKMLELLECVLKYLGELSKPLHVGTVARDIYHAVLKILLVLQHDYPSFLSENHMRLTAAIPPHCVQLQNMILAAKPQPYFNLPNPMDPALKIEHLEEIRMDPTIRTDIESVLRDANLLELLSRALKTGPSEALVADIAHAIQHNDGRGTTIGFVPVNVDMALIDSIVLFVGKCSIRRAAVEGGPTFISGSPDAALLSMLAKELRPEARYYFIIAIVNQLRFPNSHTYYFSLALLDLFGTDQNDHEEAEVRQQITRVLFERMGTNDTNQPWGVVVTILELLKNPKYMFFKLPFVSNNPEIAQQFSAFHPHLLH